MPVDFKKSNAPLNTITRDTVLMSEKTGNVYEMVNIIAKRANQISIDIKDELSKKLQEFASYTDSLEEVFENLASTSAFQSLLASPRRSSVRTSSTIVVRRSSLRASARITTAVLLTRPWRPSKRLRLPL